MRPRPQRYGTDAALHRHGQAFKLREGEYLERIDWRRGESVGRGGYPAVLQVQFWSSAGRASRIYGTQTDGLIQAECAGDGREIFGLQAVLRLDDAGGGLQEITAAELRTCFRCRVLYTVPYRGPHTALPDYARAVACQSVTGSTSTFSWSARS